MPSQISLFFLPPKFLLGHVKNMFLLAAGRKGMISKAPILDEVLEYTSETGGFKESQFDCHPFHFWNAIFPNSIWHRSQHLFP